MGAGVPERNVGASIWGQGSAGGGDNGSQMTSDAK